MSESDALNADLQTKSAKPVSEFNDGRKIPQYAWKRSFLDWWNQAWRTEYSDTNVESRLLSFLPFFPKGDLTRTAKLIDTDVGNGNYIHEFCIENNQETNETGAGLPDQVKDIVLIHGYAASLGLFFDNFDRLSSIPGVRVHAIDMLGFGLSSRPKYPKYKNDSVADIYQNEDWFLDSIEEWRKRRGIEKFVLIGHSFGGYLSCAYAMKYNKRLIDEGKQSMIQKLVLLSPVGVERNSKSLLKEENMPAAQVSASERRAENEAEPEVQISREVTSNQEDIVAGTSGTRSRSSETLKDETRLDKNSTSNENRPKTWRDKLVPWLWEKHASPFSIVRNVGPMRSKFISNWTTHRFSHIYYTNPEKFQSIHDYFYRIFNGAGSGEYAITRILSFGALARLPLLDRCPDKFVNMNLPTLWLYGDKDWMSRDAGQEMTKEINDLCKSEGKLDLAQFGVVTNAGHHLYLDNPQEFGDKLLDFLHK